LGLKIGISPKVKIKKAKANATANTKAPNFASLENLIGLNISTKNKTRKVQQAISFFTPTLNVNIKSEEFHSIEYLSANQGLNNMM